MTVRLVLSGSHLKILLSMHKRQAEDTEFIGFFHGHLAVEDDAVVAGVVNLNLNSCGKSPCYIWLLLISKASRAGAESVRHVTNSAHDQLYSKAHCTFA